MITRAFASALMFFAVSGACAHAQTVEPLSIEGKDGSHAFQVEIADSPDERAQGLMHRKEMAKDHGMLFVYPELSQTGVWMKNTLIPLDMLFIDEDGTILAIAENARPGSLRTIDPGFRVKGFLEINGGLAKELGIKPGDKVSYKVFKDAHAHGG
ncbi:MAG: DUF192 domain-containing protein [Hyphomonadaceae bacterium]